MAEGKGMWRRLGNSEDGFRYVKVDGKPLKTEAGLGRIKRLAIPPAWTDVHIAPSGTAKVQAYGWDAAGRKQYRYHEDYVSKRAARKFGKMLPFARSLPTLREKTNEHLKLDDLSREHVLATVVRLMCRAFFRVGSERYAVNNQTFGIATLEKRHIAINGTSLVFSYSGKGRIDQRRVVADTPLVEVLEQILELPGDRLFRYRDDDGEVVDVTASDVNSYLKDVLHERYTSKDIRTWGGTVRAATILADIGPADTKKEAESNIVLVCKLVSSELGNTPAIARSAYIHPAVLDKYLKGETIAGVMRKSPRPVEAEAPVDFYPEEAALMRMLATVEED